MQFNEAQQGAVDFYQGPCLTLAGPGSGKTAVITHRTKNLIEKYGVSPSEILVVTFTKAAAMEMKERFLSLTNQTSTTATFGTFHAVFFTVLKYAYHYRAENIIRDEQKVVFIRNLLRHFPIDYEDENECIQTLLSEISGVKNSNIPIEHYYSSNFPEHTFRDVFMNYQKMLQKNRLIDFDDMLVYTYELFSQRKDILALWQKKFRYILIDEFQDINGLQYEIIRMLAAPENNLFVVGDDDQSIYRFRQARPEIMLNFEKDYADAKRIVLNYNYRSDGNIVAAAGRLIAHNTGRFAKDIKAFHPAKEAVVCKTYRTQREENLGLIHALKEYTAAGGDWSDAAVLFRTNTQPRLLMQQLMEYNIPFRTRDNIPNIYEHWIAKDMESYLRIAHGSRRRADFLQIMNRPNRYIGRDSLEEDTVAFDVWADYYDKMEQSWIARRIDRLYHDCKMLAGMKPFAAVNYIRKGIGYDDYIKEYADQRGMNEEELLDILEQLTDMTKEFDSFDDWQEQKEKYLKELQRAMEKQRTKGEGVVLSTLHSSKGLEYDVVFLIDVNEKIMPYKKAVLDADLEEERRMFYVGMTRAKKQLYLFSVELLNNHSAEPSRFLKELQET